MPRLRHFGLCVSLVCAVLLPWVSGAQVNLVSTPHDPIGSGPAWVAVADLNGDGKADIVATNSLDNTISVLLSNGDGTFRPAVTYAVGTQPTGVATGDFDGDGKPDVAVALAGTKAVSVLLGNGDGTLRAATSYPTSDVTQRIVVADFNGDGKLDLAATDFSAGVDVLLGNGDGTFGPALTTPTGAYPVALATGDLNRDGKPDLAFSNNNGIDVTILLGKGDGTFDTGASYSFSASILGIVVADLNLDGKLDILEADTHSFTGGSTAVSVLLGNGDGTFAAPVAYDYAVDPVDVIVADFNGDGKPDVALTDQVTNNVRILLGNGDGTLNKFAQYAAGLSPEGMAAGDFRGNGTTDLATANYESNDVSILLGNGDGTFAGARAFDVGSTPLTFQSNPTVVVGDFNRDGKIDVTLPTQGIVLMLGNGDGTLQPATFLNAAQGYTNGGLIAADFNNDRNLDLAVTSPFDMGGGFQTAAAFLGNGNGTFQAETDYGVNPPLCVTSADFNSDGILDLLVAGAQAGSILLGDGTGKFQASLAVMPPGSAVVAGDFNGDGQADALFFDGTNLRLAAGNGDGTFQTTTLSYTFSGSPAASAMATGDFNGDGTLDVAVVNNGLSGSVSVLLGNGDGTFQAPVNYAAGDAPQSIAVTDINGDGHQDLVLALRSGAVVVLVGNGDGTFQPMLSFGSTDLPGTSGGGMVSVGVADLNGDGRPDVIVADGLGNPSKLQFGTVTVLLNQTGISSRATSITLSSSLNPAASGQSVTLTAIVAPAGGSGSPTGSVNFLDGSNVVGVVPLSGGGALFTTSALSVGNHNLTASYSGDNSFAGSSSVPLAEVVNAAPFTVSASGTGSATVSAGQPAQYQLTLAPGTAQSQSVNLSCSGAPTGATCTVSPASLTLSGSSSSPVTVTVQTSARMASLAASTRPIQAPRKWNTFWLGLFLAGVIISGRPQRRVTRLSIPLALLLLLSACGGGSSSSGGSNPTPSGNYTLTITAQSTIGTQQIQLKLIVQ